MRRNWTTSPSRATPEAAASPRAARAREPPAGQPLIRVPHKGGKKLEAGSSEYTTLLAWIAAVKHELNQATGQEAAGSCGNPSGEGATTSQTRNRIASARVELGRTLATVGESGGLQRTEDRGQRTEDRGQRTGLSGFVPQVPTPKFLPSSLCPLPFSPPPSALSPPPARRIRSGPRRGATRRVSWAFGSARFRRPEAP